MRDVKRTARASPRRTAPAEAGGLAARRVAAAVVAEALARSTSVEDASAWDGPPGDVALARAIAVTTFRRFGTIRDALGERLSKGLPRDPGIMAILATGAAQILFLDVPDHAAVDLAVRLASEGGRTRHLSGTVNAVLRRLAREREVVLAEFTDPMSDLPPWLAARWARTYGPDRSAAIAARHRAGAPIDLTVRSDPEGWAERLGGHLLPTGSVRVLDRTAVRELPGFAEGAWWVQDAAAALPARLLAPRQGERILDLCAAPGGKTAQLAAAGAHVTALDRSAPRLERLRANLARLRLGAEVVCADALAFAAEPFDAVLLDAPCTATGTIRRHPDIPWIKGEAELASLVRLQGALIERAAGLVRPGGRLVYCVCSLEPEEGEDRAASFLAARPGWTRDPVDPAALGLDARASTPAGDLRTAPDLWPGDARDERGGLDGFFAVRLSRTAA